MVSGGDDGSHNHGVYEGASGFGASHLEDDGEGRGGGGFCGQTGVGPGNVETCEGSQRYSVFVS
jgi:hypothetical protein